MIAPGCIKAERPCPGCGIVGKRRLWPAYTDEQGRHLTECAALCGACKMESKARRYEASAAVLRSKAAAMRERARVRKGAGS